MGKRLICQDSALEPVLNPSSYYGTWICGAFATFFKAQKIPPEATKNDWWKACVKAAHLIAVLKLINCCILQDSSFLINEPTRPLYSYAHNGTIGSFEIVGVEMNFKSFALFWEGRGDECFCEYIFISLLLVFDFCKALILGYLELQF